MILLQPEEARPQVPRRTLPRGDAQDDRVLRVARGSGELKEDDHAAVWYEDFLDFVREERIFATMCTPAGYGAEDARWDTWRICEFDEILGVLRAPLLVHLAGLDPGPRADLDERQRGASSSKTAQLLEDGAIFAFGLSEKEHGADLYSTEMTLDAAARRQLPRQRSQVLHRQRQRGGAGLDLRQVRRHGRVLLLRRGLAAPEATSASRTSCHSQNFVAEFALQRLPGQRGGHPVARRGGLGRGAQHGQHRQVQPRLGLDRHLHPRLLRGHPPRREPPSSTACT